jgi:hypothetical protein
MPRRVSLLGVGLALALASAWGVVREPMFLLLLACGTIYLDVWPLDEPGDTPCRWTDAFLVARARREGKRGGGRVDCARSTRLPEGMQEYLSVYPSLRLEPMATQQPGFCLHKDTGDSLIGALVTPSPHRGDTRPWGGRPAEAEGSMQGRGPYGSRWSVLPRPAPYSRDWDSDTATGAVIP